MDYSSPMESLIVLVDSALICKCFVTQEASKAATLNYQATD